MLQNLDLYNKFASYFEKGNESILNRYKNKNGTTVLTRKNGAVFKRRADGTIIRIRDDPNTAAVDKMVTKANPFGKIVRDGVVTQTPGSAPGYNTPTLPPLDDPGPTAPTISSSLLSGPITLSRFGFDPLGKLPQFKSALGRAGRPTTRSLIGGS